MSKKSYDFDKSIDRTNTNCVKWDLRSLYFKNPDLIPLWVADMDFETPVFIIDALKKRLEHPVLGYTFRPKEFNAAFQDWALRKYNWDIKPEWITFSPGVVSAVSLAVMGFTKPGDEVIVQPPVYFPFFKSVEGLNRKLVYNQLREIDGRLCMDYENLEDIITARTRMIIISNPHNPGGSAWTGEELNKLAAICEKHNIFMVSDEIHSDLVFEPAVHTPFVEAQGDYQVRSITCMAASKSFNLAGLATSMVVIPDEEIKKEYDDLLQTVHIGGGNLFGAIATMTAYREGWDWMQQLLAYLKANRDYLVDFVNRELPGIRILIPEATYLAWIDFSGLGKSDEELQEWMTHKVGIGMNPGTMFGPGGNGFLRLNFASPRQQLVQALQKIKEIL